MLLAALGLGLLMGLVIGALGGGGSILTVPALVYVLGLTAQEATTASLVIVGITAAVASAGHARAGHTRWRPGLLLAAAGIPAALVATHLNARVDEDVLLLAFAVLMVLAALGMLLRPSEDKPGPAAQAAPRRASTAMRTAAVGLGIGALTGFFGVGGGFVIVPALVLALNFPMAAAVGTSLLVIAANSGVALAARALDGNFAWDVIVPFTVAAVPAALAGQQFARRLPTRSLSNAFAVLLIVVAGYVAMRASGVID